MPTQKIRIEPMRERLLSAASVISGRIRPARAVILPWKSATGMAEKMQPLPMEQVMTIMMIRSRTALVARMEKSPVRPSSIDPTMAMAPMHTVSDAVTKASTKPPSLPFPVLTFSQVPKRSKPASIFRISPIKAPMARQPMISRELPLTRPAPSTVSIPSKAPARPMNRVATPHTLVRES